MISEFQLSAGTAALHFHSSALPLTAGYRLASIPPESITILRKLSLPEWNGKLTDIRVQPDWAKLIDIIDRFTTGHTWRVTQISLQLGEALNLPKQTLNIIFQGCLLHDLGKIGIPDEILLKPGPLDHLESNIIRQHPVLGYRLLVSLPALRSATNIPYCHHEKLNGTGYPRGLSGNDIPLSARITAVADVWDALTSERPYRAAWSSDQAAEHMLIESGRHFDPAIVAVLLSMYENGELN